MDTTRSATTVNGKPGILLVEDNPADVRLTVEALRDANAHSRMDIVRDGVEAMAFIRGVGKYAGSPRPDVILLDLNLPRKDGRAVLREMKADPDLRCIPVVVLTSSEADEDVCAAYQLCANCYISKPVKLEKFLIVIQSIEHFWLHVAKLPQGGGRA